MNNSSLTNSSSKYSAWGTSSSITELMSWTVTFVLVDIAIIAGNALVFYYYRKSKQAQRSRAYYFLLNLALLDELVGILSLPLYIFFLVLWIRTRYNPYDILYRMYMAIDITSGLGSMFTVVLISVDRCFAVVFPFKHRCASRRVYFYLLFGVWLTASGITVAWLTWLDEGPTTFIYVSSICFSLAIITISMVNLIMTIKLRMRTKQQQNIRKISLHEKKLTRILKMVTFAFFLTWIPFQCVNSVYFILDYNTIIPVNVIYFTKFLQYGGSFVNSVIYYNNNPEFKNIMRRFFCNSFRPSKKYKVTTTAHVIDRTNRLSLEPSPPVQ